MDKDKFAEWLKLRRVEIEYYYANEKEIQAAIHQIDFIQKQVSSGVFDKKI